jgi:hypothetical protein
MSKTAVPKLIVLGMTEVVCPVEARFACTNNGQHLKVSRIAYHQVGDSLKVKRVQVLSTSLGAKYSFVR